jgi:hypothetical protein
MQRIISIARATLLVVTVPLAFYFLFTVGNTQARPGSDDRYGSDERYVSPDGSDAENDCRSVQQPCETIQHAIEQIPLGSSGTVRLADGVYSGGVDAAHHRIVRIEGNCGDPSAVTVHGGFMAEDLIIMTAICLQTEWVSCRQYAILDLSQVWFLTHPTGYHIAANESCKVNLMDGLRVLGDSQGFVSASQGSVVLAYGDITVPEPISLNGGQGCFFFASSKAYIETLDVQRTGIFGLGMLGIQGQPVCTLGSGEVALDPSLYLGTLGTTSGMTLGEGNTSGVTLAEGNTR